MDGVEAIVDVEKSTAVVVVVRCWKGAEAKCIKLRSAIIKTVLNLQRELMGALSVEECFILPDELASYPLQTVDSLFTFSICQVARAVKEGMDAITDTDRKEVRTISFCDLLHFEPYSCLPQELITQLFDEGNAESEVSDALLYDCAKFAYQNKDQLKNVLLLREHESEYHGAITQCHDQYYNDPCFKCYEVFRTWKKFTKEPTYNGLRKALDEYSIFCGRNPLVSCMITFYNCHSYLISLSSPELYLWSLSPTPVANYNTW